MKKNFLFLLGLIAIDFSWGQGCPYNIVVANNAVAQYVEYICLLKAAERDSILSSTPYAYETASKKVFIEGLKPYTKVYRGDSYRCEVNGFIIEDTIAAIVIKDKNIEPFGKPLVDTTTAFCPSIKRWIRDKVDTGCLTPCDCQMMKLIEIPAATILVRRETLLQCNNIEKYFEK